ncbi:unnamed protein product [Ixodes pacificus]
METVVRLTRWSRRVFGRLKSRVRHKLTYPRIVFYSLVYNEFADIYYVGDTFMEPLFWIVDHFAKAMGPIFVTTITIVACTIITIAYTIGIPYWWQRNTWILAIALVIGHWLLVNIVFHYWMALTTNPGTPPEAICFHQGSLLPEVVSICKKCIAPKPPRTHHCSICNRCVLKMDHHCPWLNNCIGHFTHRYFFMFCSYMLLGIMFLMVFGYKIAYEEYFNKPTTVRPGVVTFTSIACSLLQNVTVPTAPTKNSRDFARRYYITFTALVCIGVFFALGALTMWHARLITNGETSIEAHINKKERIRLGKEGIVYVNPYDFGPRRNWRRFLGLTHGRTWRHLLWPSAHPPEGSGLTWDTIYQTG